MKLPSLRTLAAALFSASLLAPVSHAAGLSITTTCRTLNANDRTQVSLKLVRKIDYKTRLAQVDAEYEGKMQWDAEPYSAQGKFTAPLSVNTSVPYPNLPNDFSVAQGSENLSMTLQKEPNSKTPFVAHQVNFKVQVNSGVLGMGAQYALLKFALPPSSGTVAAFGNLYITNRSESSVTTPDGGGSVSMICENRVNDL